MKIKKIKTQSDPIFGTAEFEFTDNTGKIMENIVLAGENGCGKTRLLNIIYNFSLLSTQGDVCNKKHPFTIVLSEAELLQIQQSLDEDKQLESPTGELEITKDFQKPDNTWDRFEIKY